MATETAASPAPIAAGMDGQVRMFRGPNGGRNPFVILTIVRTIQAQGNQMRSFSGKEAAIYIGTILVVSVVYNIILIISKGV